jgi:hypothetical protein
MSFEPRCTDDSVDRAVLANAYVSGMKEDINISGTQYNLLVTILSVGCKFLHHVFKRESNLLRKRQTSLAKSRTVLSSRRSPRVSGSP